MRDTASRIFDLSQDIRDVALYRDGDLKLAQRESLQHASSSETDTYEALLVNPTLLTLARQRGDIDCGGAGFIVVGYGDFHQLVIALKDGHVSVAFEKAANPLEFVSAIKAACE